MNEMRIYGTNRACVTLSLVVAVVVAPKIDQPLRLHLFRRVEEEKEASRRSLSHSKSVSGETIDSSFSNEIHSTSLMGSPSHTNQFSNGTDHPTNVAATTTTTTTTTMNGVSSKSKSSSSSYPFTRSQECAWQPEEVARHLAQLALTSDVIDNTSTSSSSSSSTHLLHHGWSSRQIEILRRAFGPNSLQGDTDDDATRHGSLACLAPILSALAGQVKEPLILMLLGSAALSVFLGNVADAISIAIALLIVSAVAAVQEYRSEAALSALQNLVPHTCTVVRNGVVLDKFLARHLVVGDLVLLSTGDRVPADVRVVDSVELTTDESSLTGENHPVVKTGESIQLDQGSSSLTRQSNICFAGTLVRAGRGRALVVATGEHTEFGKVATELAAVTARKSPLQEKMDELGQRLAYLSSIAIAIIAVVGWLMGRPFLETVTVAVSLAVAAIPEGLPICVTVTLALGVLRMARHSAIVKKLPVVESLGCATAVCSDKTGTLTQNEMTVRSIFTLAYPDRQFGFTGVGYNTKTGQFVEHGVIGESLSRGANKSRSQSPSPLPQTEVSDVFSTQSVAVPTDSDEMKAIFPLFYTACLCNNATLVESLDSAAAEGHTGGTLSGQPTELALLVATEKAGLADPRPQYHRLQEVPFTSDRKCMEVKARPVSGKQACDAFLAAGLAEVASATEQVEQQSSSFLRKSFSRKEKAPSFDGNLYFIKGMPEKVLGECQAFTGANGNPVGLQEDDRTQVLRQSRRMAASGLRVLALAYGKTLGRLVFAGLVAMEDPPREGVQECVRQLRRGGVKVMMVTGDSKETALAIAHRCGILGSIGLGDLLIDGGGGSHPAPEDLELGSSEALSGEQLDAIPPESLADSIAGVKVFYRVVPRHKLAIVRALQSRGDIVAMTGDGVNDATALKGADIGVAMGKNGTDVAKEAADVVLADDDFRTITMAIAEGKGIFFNIRCFLSFQLSTSFAALAMASVATVFGMPSPLNAMQILWINIIMDGPPAQSLGVEPVDEKILNAKPRKADDPIVTKALLLRAISSAALIVILTLGVFAHELSDDGKVSRRDTTMTFMMFVNCDLFNAYVCRSAERCFYELDAAGNPAFLWSVGGSILGQLLVIYWSPLQEVFQTEALSPSDLLAIILLSSSVLALDTVRKKVFGHIFSDGFNPSPRAARSPNSGTSWLDFSKRRGRSNKAQRAPRSSVWGARKSNKARSALAL